MVKQRITDFDIHQISNSGQCFRMDKTDNGAMLIAGDRYLDVIYKDDEWVFSCSQKEFDEVWQHYFDFNTNYSKFKEMIDTNDSYMMKAAECGSGIRILNQELYETIISFIISQQNNITRIKKCIRVISEKFGEEKKNYKDEIYYAFPKIEVLSKLNEEDLKECGLGYRSRYIIETSRAISIGFVDLNSLIKMSYEEAKNELIKLSGIGNKVADCVCLFALHHIDAFPIDTHIRDVLNRHYKDGFPMERYEGFAGVLQQYAFYYEIYGEKFLRLSGKI